MSKDDIVQIKIGTHSVGIAGFYDVMEDMAEQNLQMPDAELMSELIDRLSKKNYIPHSAKENYGRAFLREFKKFTGKPHEDIAQEGLQIQVLGQGCAQCDRLERDVIEVLSEIHLSADVDHVRDVKKIGTYGVMGTPALVINGKVMAVGKVPSKAQLKKWFSEYDV